MLGKLMKYEIKSTARIFLPFYAAILLLSILNRILFSLPSSIELLNIPRVVSMATYVFIIIASFIMTYVVLIQRFYKSLLADEGYLSFTLPVKTVSHILSKGITALMWLIFTMLTALVSILIMIPDYSELRQLPEIIREINQAFAQYNFISFGLFFFIVCLIALTALVTSILMIYTAISFGQLSNKHKVATSFGAYVGIYAATQTINMIILTVGGIILGNRFDVFSSSSAIMPEDLPGNLLPIILFGVLGLELIYAISYFFITRYVLDKKLNLE